MPNYFSRKMFCAVRPDGEYVLDILRATEKATWNRLRLRANMSQETLELKGWTVAPVEFRWSKKR